MEEYAVPSDYAKNGRNGNPNGPGSEQKATQVAIDDSNDAVLGSLTRVSEPE